MTPRGVWRTGRVSQADIVKVHRKPSRIVATVLGLESVVSMAKL
jgi:hypothetical protein